MAERITAVEVEVSNMKETNTREHAEMKNMIKCFIDSAPSKFASKNVEKVLYTGIGVVVAGFLGKIMDII